MQTINHYSKASLWRRICAMFYDLLIIIALFIGVSMLYHTFVNMLMNGLQDAPTGYNIILSILLLCTLFGFLAGYWHLVGHTPGMLAWKICIRNLNGKRISKLQCLQRFIIAIFSVIFLGAGFWLMIFTSKKQTWHDTLSHSQIIMYHHD